ncbi:unnamed protein product [Durusdinium trenchii]|uniref:Uncharacterized protein n=1 Tax=Durusdinium trenchii TaxID=1381693 RepID=A0ABP0PDH6_9DINO
MEAEAEAKRQKTDEGYVARPQEPEVKEEVKQEIKQEEKSEVKQEMKPEVKQEVKQEVQDTPQEKETDAAPITGMPLRPKAFFDTVDCLLNVVPSLNGQVLMPLTEGGLQYLLAGARANVGVKSGRYFYEVKVIETLNPSEGQQRTGRSPMPRQLLKLGFSTLESPLLIGETDESASFDSEGYYYCGKQKHGVSQRLCKDQVIAVLLNLDPSSPNKNTISLFREGVRITQPQTLPACLAGKTLYPHVCFKNITVQTNFGPPLMPLPFKCHMVGQAPATDAVVGIEPAPNGTYEVLFPIAIPDEGTFDWLDDFLKKNPRYVELSDRAMGEWAERSGVFRNKNYSWKHCNDKPDLQTGLPLLDDFSARKILGVVAPTQPRNYVVMEIKSNLLRDERQLFIRRFKRPGFKVVAQVMMGEPPAEFKAEVHKILLEEKQKKADEEWQQRKAQREAERVLRAREKEMEEVRRKAEEEALARAQAEATAQAEAVKAQLMAQGGVTEIAATEPAVPSVEIIDDGDAPSAQATPNAPVPPGEVKHEKPDVVMTEAKETKPPEKKAEEPPEEPRPVVTLSEEEKAICFKQKATSDLTSWTLGGHFTRFSLPEADEGFDEIRYVWNPEAVCKEYLHKWIIKNKILCRMEDILPSDWFHSKAAEWQKVLADWHSKQGEFAAKQAYEVEEPKEEKKDVEDVFAVEDICNTAAGEPLFAKFTFEDWALLSLRLELHLLVHSFRRDANDPERIGIHESHLPFYYNKYYKKTFNVKHYGVETNLQLLTFIKDTVEVNQEVLQAVLSEDVENFDIFVKLTEAARRDRMQKLENGDESARLRFARPEEIRPDAHKAGYKGQTTTYKGQATTYKGQATYKGAGRGGYQPQKGVYQAGFRAYGSR